MIGMLWLALAVGLVVAAIYFIFLRDLPRVERALHEVLEQPDLPDDDVEGFDRAHGGGW